MIIQRLRCSEILLVSSRVFLGGIPRGVGYTLRCRLVEFRCVFPFDKFVHEGDIVVTVFLIRFHASLKLG